ncbi:uncharacterized protein RCC_09043 [Ramularia collo-cygni]|uniref:Uncharacterized protein n=1 Tax=Ramularia collo-cygni TaxID=112498 RepID=A0A2D3VGP3_9PEZI|nr:uncharacterized protein RCC_09043 [Ramularia collo-cygni]CZT23331.1 uncharacterized protein RCC_09043 [Ramularia collo-cygni]
MRFSRMFPTIAAAAIGLSTFVNSAAIEERAANSAVVVVQHLAALSTSTAYSTSEVTVWACDSTVTDCPADSSTSLVSVVTSVVPFSTTICPLTVTSVSTSGVPGTNSGPLSTVTVSSSSGTFYTIPAPSAASNVSSVTGSQSASGPSSTGVVTLHSTITSMSTVTVSTSGSLLSSPLTGTLVNATQASLTGTAPSISYQPPGVATTLSSTEVSPFGSTAYGTGAVTSSTNGTMVTPTLPSSTESIVPFTGAAEGRDYKRMVVCMVVAVGSAVLFI